MTGFSSPAVVMFTGIISHDACLLHDPGPGHPETASRLAAILAALGASDNANLRWIEAPCVDSNTLHSVHSSDYVRAVFEKAAASPLWNLDPDTVVSTHSGEAALRAAGALCEAIDRIAAGEIENAFCAVRPPGHHAKRDASGGFCLFNNVAIAVAWARRRRSYRRILVVDFDVHHGDGTQSLVLDDPDVLFVSIHQSPFDPWSGSSPETGPHHTIVNLPIAAGTTGPQFRKTLQDAIGSRIAEFAPELILISAGFDGHQNDPIGGLRLTTADYGWLGGYLASTARTFCQGRLAAVLEGGYDDAAAAASAAAFVQALSERPGS